MDRRSTVSTSLATRVLLGLGRSYAPKITENQRLYAGIGDEETGRWSESGYERVFHAQTACGLAEEVERRSIQPPETPSRRR
jgi:hypothetical protein